MQHTPITTTEEYHKQREQLLKEADALKYDNLQFNEKELRANVILLEAYEQVNKTLDDKFHVRPINYRDQVESSKLFKMMSDIPKGVHQHTHNPMQIHSEWFLEHTFNGDVYVHEEKGLEIFKGKAAPEGWKNAKQLREEAGDKKKFDEDFVKKYFYMTTQDYDHHHSWHIFDWKMVNRMNIGTQESAWESCLEAMFNQAIDENFSCLQIRMLVPFFEQENFMDPEKEVALYRRVLAKVQQRAPGFTVGIVVTGLRIWDLGKIKQFLDLAHDLRKKHHDLIIGFDVVGEECGRNAIDLATIFVEASQKAQKEGFDFPFLLHGGESQSRTNTNLYDLLLCDTKRIGHGINLFKHPYLISKFKERGVCIEVNPLSNQVLQYVPDLRMHPAIGFHHAGLKISISSDDAGVFNYHTGWNFFVTVVCFEFNLIDLKRVIVNSLETSCLDKDIQDKLIKDWQAKWDKFIDDVLALKY